MEEEDVTGFATGTGAAIVVHDDQSRPQAPVPPKVAQPTGSMQQPSCFDDHAARLWNEFTPFGHDAF